MVLLKPVGVTDAVEAWLQQPNPTPTPTPTPNQVDGGKDAAAEMVRDGQPMAIMLLMGGGRHVT